jgi:CubicO group peptidase (beta-lactamase class C family)
MNFYIQRRQRLSLLFLFAVALLSLVRTVDVRADAIDRIVERELKTGHEPGIAVAVIRNGRVIKIRGYGLADVERKVVVTADTVFEIGSITKQFTATAIMMLVEAGKLGLEETIGRYLIDLPEAWQPITIRQLLTHTSGIPDYEEIMGYGGYRNVLRPAQVISIAAARPLDFAPGTKWNYSNTGYFLLTMILEKVSGETCAQFFHDHIFVPAGMDRTRTSEPLEIISNRALGYEYKDEHLENRDPMQPSATGGAGMIASTVGDLVKWNAVLERQSLLRPESYAQIWTDAPLADAKPSGYGFGWFVSPVMKHRSQRHGGQTAGFTADFWRLPDDRVTVIVLTNLYGGSPELVSSRIAQYEVPQLRYRAIHDPDQALGQKVLEFYAHRLDREVYTKPLSPEYAAKRMAGWSDGVAYFKRIGAPRSIELLEVTLDGPTPSYRYRLVYGDLSRVVVVTFNKDALIDDLIVAFEE